jgi:hypothetical protein
MIVGGLRTPETVKRSREDGGDYHGENTYDDIHHHAGHLPLDAPKVLQMINDESFNPGQRPAMFHGSKNPPWIFKVRAAPHYSGPRPPVR